MLLLVMALPATACCCCCTSYFWCCCDWLLLLLQVSETMLQITFFKADPKLIKRRINTLIDREYLERDPDNMQSYRYLA